LEHGSKCLDAGEPAISGLLWPVAAAHSLSSSAMIGDQRRLSEQLQLLHELSKSDLNKPYFYQSATVRSHKDSCNLDAIAVALTTGKPGDAFAAAFEKRQHLQLVLAKNGPLNTEDMAATDELLSLIGNPTIDTAMDIFPFLLRRCGANINKRIHKLHTSLQVIRDNFALELNTYTPIANIETEFPNMDYEDVPPRWSALSIGSL